MTAFITRPQKWEAFVVGIDGEIERTLDPIHHRDVDHLPPHRRPLGVLDRALRQLGDVDRWCRGKTTDHLRDLSRTSASFLLVDGCEVHVRDLYAG